MTAKPTADLAAMDLYDLALAFREEDSDHHAIYRELTRRDERERRLLDACQFYIAGKDAGCMLASNDKPNEYGGTEKIRTALAEYTPEQKEPRD